MFQRMRTRRTTSQAGRLFSVTIVLLFSMLMVRCSEIFTVPGILPALPQETFGSTSHSINCAIACSKRECITIYYQDGNCTMGGTGLAPNITGPHILQKMAYTAPLSFRTLPNNLPTYGSTSYNQYFSPAKAVDGNLGSWWATLNSDANSWWKLDMQGSFWVHGIDILTRAVPDDYSRFHDVEVRVGSTDVLNGDFSAWTLFGFYKGPSPLNPGYINYTSPEGVFGKYVGVRKDSSPPIGALKLMDVRVTVRI